jgi:glutathione synthase/RimK-type ligase-like ATP-grasp enzyme
MLAETLGWDYEEGCLAGEINRYKVIFRYGNSVTFGRDNNFHGLVINPAKATEQSANKLTCRRILVENGFPVPAVYDIDGFMNVPVYPVIARPFHHSQGRRFYVANDPAELMKYFERGCYAQDVVDKKDEFRLFILNGKIIEASIKVKARADADMMIRNHRKGWVFDRIRVADLNQPMKSACVDAVNIIGLNWCAVDACIANDGTPYIFELNSAPGLIPRKAQRLAEKINQYLLEERGYENLCLTPPHIDDDINDPGETPEPRRVRCGVPRPFPFNPNAIPNARERRGPTGPTGPRG